MQNCWPSYHFNVYLHIYDAFGRLLSIAEETLAEFLSKATGTAVDWVQMPGMKVQSYFYNFPVAV